MMNIFVEDSGFGGLFSDIRIIIKATMEMWTNVINKCRPLVSCRCRDYDIGYSSHARSLHFVKKINQYHVRLKEEPIQFKTRTT